MECEQIEITDEGVLVPDTQGTRTPFYSSLASLITDLRISSLSTFRDIDIRACNLYTIAQLEIPITGSFSWMVQSGLTIQEALLASSDIDVCAKGTSKDVLIFLHSAVIDDTSVISDGWEERIVEYPVLIRGKVYTLKLVHWTDVIETVLADLTYKDGRFPKSGTADQYTAHKLIRRVQALVYLRNTFIGNASVPSALLGRMQTGTIELQNRANHVVFTPVDSDLSADEITQMTRSAVEQIVQKMV